MNTAATYNRVDAPRFSDFQVHDCAECGHEELLRPVWLAGPDGRPFPVGSGCAARLTGRPAAEWDADLAAGWVAAATFHAQNAWAYLAICLPGRVTAKFRDDLIRRGADAATADAAIAAYKALAKVGAVRTWADRV